MLVEPGYSLHSQFRFFYVSESESFTVLDAATCVGAYNLPGRLIMAPTSLVLHAVSVQAPGSRGIAQMAQRLPFFLFSPGEGELS